MARYSFIKKIPGGKTIKIDVDVDDNVIRNIVVSGDFFAYPEERLEELENAIKGKTISSAINIIKSFSDKIILLGVSFDDIIELLNKVLNKVEESN